MSVVRPLAPCPDRYRSLLGHPEETYVTHSGFTDPKTQSAFEIVATTRRLSFCDSASHALLHDFPLSHVYSVDLHPDDRSTFILTMAHVSAKSKDLLEEREVKSEGSAKANLWIIVIRRLLRDFWQEFYEEHLVVDPEIYQMFRIGYFVKTSSKKLYAFVLSTTTIYGFKMGSRSIQPEQLIFKAHIEEITGQASYRNDNKMLGYIVHVHLTPSKKKKEDPQELNILFRNEEDKTWFDQEVQRLHWQRTGKIIEIKSRTIKRASSITMRKSIKFSDIPS